MPRFLRVAGADYNLLISPWPLLRAVVWPPGAWCLAAKRGITMNLPKIDISALPDLEKLTGVFGSLAHPAKAIASDDSIVMIMVFVYNVCKN
jgi:hypothetical protein